MPHKYKRQLNLLDLSGPQLEGLLEDALEKELSALPE